MSQRFSQLRTEAASIPRYVRQENLVTAVRVMRNLLQSMTSKNIPKKDREEAEKHVDTGLFAIMLHPRIKKEFQMEIQYKPGNEKEVADYMDIILEVFDEEIRLTHQQESAEFQNNEDDLSEEALLESLKQEQNEKLHKALTYSATGFLDQAEALFKEIMQSKGTSAEAFVTLAVYFHENNEIDRCITCYQKALELEPDNASWHNKLAMILRKAKRFEEAEKSYFALAKLVKRSAPLYFNFARLYLEWEQFDKAVKAGKAALKLDPEFNEAKKLLRYIDKLQSQ